MVRRARLVISVIVASVLLMLVPSFFLFGLLVTTMNGEETCGTIGHLRMPRCDSVSWEFGVGAGALLLALLLLVGTSIFGCCVVPHVAKQRFELRERRAREAEAGEAPL